MKKHLLHIILALGAVLLVGCGGGGGGSDDTTQAFQSNPEIDTQPDENSNQVYQNKTMPIIDGDTVPDILLKSTGSATEKLGKSNKETSQAYGFVAFKKNAKFFYGMQTEMNINLSYYDSVWSQIEEYCEDSVECSVPDGKVVFKYTQALYNNDVALITDYQEKTGDQDTYREFLEYGHEVIGTEIPLSTASLIRDVDAEYENVLVTDILSIDENKTKNIGVSLLKWNTDKSKFLIRDEYYVSEGENHFVEFKYDNNQDQIESQFSTNHYYSYGNEAILKFIEKDGRIEFFENVESDDFVTSYYSEGYLDEDGGRMVSFSPPEGYDERFDSQGNILSEIKCFDKIYLDTDYTNLASDMICDIGDPEIIKDIITQNVYSLGSAVFDDVKSFSGLSNPDSKSIVKFEDNNTLFAIVDCSIFTADYLINEFGITFSSIIRTISPDLKCIYPENEENFENLLNNGLGAYNTAYDFWPTFDRFGSANDFNLTKFNEKLYSELFVDSPLMNIVFNIQSSHEYTNIESGKSMLLMGSPDIKIRDNKIMIELVDASFDADIEILDPTHIKFVNVNRVDKTNVTYPEDVNLSCVEENLGTPDECFEDPYSELINSDKKFADMIERFLNEIVEVSVFSSGYEDASFTGSELSFLGTTRMPEEPIIPLELTVGGNTVTSSRHTPVLETLPDGIKEITTLSMNKEGDISLNGVDAGLFTINEGNLYFVAEIDASIPLDADSDGVYKVNIYASSGEQHISYELAYRIVIPGTIEVKEIKDLVGIWDHSEFVSAGRIHYQEILANGQKKIYDYNEERQCFEKFDSSMAVRLVREGVFVEYNIESGMMNREYTAEIFNDTLVRRTNDAFLYTYKVRRAKESVDELSGQLCN